jgi:hypothetical protein
MLSIFTMSVCDAVTVHDGQTDRPKGNQTERQLDRQVKMRGKQRDRKVVRSHVPLKYRFIQYLHGTTSQKMAFFMVTAVKTSILHRKVER